MLDKGPRPEGPRSKADVGRVSGWLALTKSCLPERTFLKPQPSPNTAAPGIEPDCLGQNTARSCACHSCSLELMLVLWPS